MRKLFLMLLLVASFPVSASYTGNHNSTVSILKIYNNETIYFWLSQMPTDHGCSTNYFILDPSLTEKQRDRYYSMLLAARASNASVNVGYDKVNPSCISGRPVVYALSY